MTIYDSIWALEILRFCRERAEKESSLAVKEIDGAICHVMMIALREFYPEIVSLRESLTEQQEFAAWVHAI